MMRPRPLATWHVVDNGDFCPGPSPAISRLLIVTSGRTAVCVEGTASLTLLGLASGLQRGKLELRETQVMWPKAMRWGWGSVQTAAGLDLSPGSQTSPPPQCGTGNRWRSFWWLDGGLSHVSPSPRLPAARALDPPQGVVRGEGALPPRGWGCWPMLHPPPVIPLPGAGDATA